MLVFKAELAKNVFICALNQSKCLIITDIYFWYIEVHVTCTQSFHVQHVYKYCWIFHENNVREYCEILYSFRNRYPTTIVLNYVTSIDSID